MPDAPTTVTGGSGPEQSRYAPPPARAYPPPFQPAQYPAPQTPQYPVPQNQPPQYPAGQAQPPPYQQPPHQPPPGQGPPHQPPPGQPPRYGQTPQPAPPYQPYQAPPNVPPQQANQPPHQAYRTSQAYGPPSQHHLQQYAQPGIRGGPEPAAEPLSPPPSRRNVVIGSVVAVVAAAGGYVGFVKYGPRPAAAATPANPGPLQQPASTQPSAGTGPSNGSTAPAPAGVSLAKVADIPENGGIVLADSKIVLTRGTGNQVHAFTAVCTHQGCLVNTVSGGTIQCPCHGSAFDATSGAVVNGPAASPLAAIPVVVVDGEVREK